MFGGTCKHCHPRAARNAVQTLVFGLIFTPQTQLDPLVEYFINKLEKFGGRHKVLFHYEGQIRITIW